MGCGAAAANRSSASQTRMRSGRCDSWSWQPTLPRSCSGWASGSTPEDAHPAAVGPTQSFEALDRGRLAGAVRAEQAEDLAAAHLERHVVDGDRRAVGLVQVLDGDDRLGSQPSLAGSGSLASQDRGLRRVGTGGLRRVGRVGSTRAKRGGRQRVDEAAVPTAKGPSDSASRVTNEPLPDTSVPPQRRLTRPAAASCARRSRR